MAKYEVAKISVTSAIGTHECEKPFNTAKELFSGLKEMQRSDNHWFYGKGSDILLNGEKIAHTNDYRLMITLELNPSIKNLVETAEG